MPRLRGARAFSWNQTFTTEDTMTGVSCRDVRCVRVKCRMLITVDNAIDLLTIHAGAWAKTGNLLGRNRAQLLQFVALGVLLGRTWVWNRILRRCRAC